MKRRRFRPTAIVFVAAAALVLFAPNEARAQNSLLAWASAIVSQAIPNANPVPSNVADRFSRAPAAGGRTLDTPGSGSAWVYDRIHRIAAWSETGDLTGAEILFVDSPPPGILPQRDLSRVDSVHGLRLNETAADVARILGVPPSRTRATSAHRSVLFVAKRPIPCGPGREPPCESDAVVKFKDGRAISIGLWH